MEKVAQTKPRRGWCPACFSSCGRRSGTWYSAGTLGLVTDVLSLVNEQLVTKSEHIICAVNYKLENTQGIHVLLAFADICQLC